MRSPLLLALALLMPLLSVGCSLTPKTLHEPRFHNPWPQLRRVAVGPFFNATENPYVDTNTFAQAYFNELQQIPGFEVIPIGMTHQAMRLHGITGDSNTDFQHLARLMKVDAIVVGSINDFSPYYPPRLALSVSWYTANPCFHPMPNGYGLPWGRAEEEFIPNAVVEAAEFDFATAQLATQAPKPPPIVAPNMPSTASRIESQTRFASNQEDAGSLEELPEVSSMPAEELAPGVVVEHPSAPNISGAVAPPRAVISPLADSGLPVQWPDPSGLIPDAPKPFCDRCRPSDKPVPTHTGSYTGHDDERWILF